VRIKPVTRPPSRFGLSLLILVVLAIGTIGVELTAVPSARAEAQAAADAAALAGAGWLIIDPEDAPGASHRALELANANTVRGRQLSLGPEDVTVDLDSGRVTVRARVKVLDLPPPLAWLHVTARATAEGMEASDAPGRRTMVRRLRLIDE
jgi:Flp pilus assembly protein TadG